MKKYNERVNDIIDKKEKMQKIHKEKMKRYSIYGITTFFIIGIVSHQLILDYQQKSVIDVPVAEQIEINQLSKFKSKQELVSKIKKDNHDRFLVTEDMIVNDVANQFGSVVAPETDNKAESTGTNFNNTYSETNTQVQGVDEADIAKTNGDFIYYIANNKLNVFNIKTGDIVLEKQIKFNENDNIIEMYLDNKYIVVIANYYKTNENNERFNTNHFVKTYIYDVDSLDLIREIETEGNYLSSRKIENDIYVVSNKNAYSYMLNEIDAEQYTLPLCKDSIESNDYVEMKATDIAYFDNTSNSTFMMVTAFSLDKLDEKANIQTYLGAGDEIYVSKNSLYVANVEYTRSSLKEMLGIYYTIPQTTSIHKFKIEDGNINYIATGKVEGALLNQFSMDEYNDYFRITTTTNGENSENNIYVLDSNMNEIGNITGLAKGERIYSTRFMGNKCYVVTYKTVDPLFVIDLSNPRNPKVLGELKIPGYSSYLHPIGENYLLGFGEDTVESSYTNWEGKEEKVAYANGLKMAIFDITDYNNPKELYSVKIGGRGSYSALLHNHKALLFDIEKGVIAFPARVYSENNGFDQSGSPKYGKEEFSGVLVYDISIKNGITERGKILHDNAQRVLRVDNILYTLSNQSIKSSDINTIELIDKLSIIK